MSINLLRHAVCAISIIIDAPPVYPWLVVKLMLYILTNRFNKRFVTIQLPYCVSVLLFTKVVIILLVPPQKLLREQNKAILMLCKPLLVVHVRIKGLFMNLYWSTKMKCLSSKSGRRPYMT